MITSYHIYVYDLSLISKDSNIQVILRKITCFMIFKSLKDKMVYSWCNNIYVVRAKHTLYTHPPHDTYRHCNWSKTSCTRLTFSHVTAGKYFYVLQNFMLKIKSFYGANKSSSYIFAHPDLSLPDSAINTIIRFLASAAALSSWKTTLDMEWVRMVCHTQGPCDQYIQSVSGWCSLFHRL